MSSKFKVLVTDAINREGLASLENHPNVNLAVELHPTPEKLTKALDGTGAWLVRSETKVTADWIQKAQQLKLIGRAGVGVDNIDLETASRLGIAVINAPQANTIAACEHTWGLILALSRNIPQADAAMKQGLWDRSKWMGTELSGKTLGVVGLGRIGREVAKRGIAFGLRIIAHDPYVSQEQAKGLGVQLAGLQELLEQSDYVTLHVPGSDKTRGLINEETAGWIKPGARLINCARGELIEEKTLVKLIESDRIKGAAIDVFAEEPLPKESPLRKLPRVILTPHLGASTEEAQRKVAEELSKEVIEFIEKGIARHAINLPGFDPDTLEALGPYLDLAEVLGRFLGQTLDAGLKEVQCLFQGGFEPRQQHPLAVAALKGVLSPTLAQPVSFVNATLIARDRGIRTSEETDPTALEGFSKLLTICAVTDASIRKVSGVVLSHGEPRIVRLDNLFVDVCPQGKMLILVNRDRPGMIGRVGQLLGKHNINIADMRVGRRGPKEDAVMVITVDEDVSSAVQKELASIDGITAVRWVRL